MKKSTTKSKKANVARQLRHQTYNNLFRILSYIAEFFAY